MDKLLVFAPWFKSFATSVVTIGGPTEPSVAVRPTLIFPIKGVNRLALINYVGTGIMKPIRKVSARIANSEFFCSYCSAKFPRFNALISHQNKGCN